MSNLDGKIVFKVKLGTEIKKLIIHNDELTYNELLLMVQRIFSDKIKPNDEFAVKYTDDENDLITISNDSDIIIALLHSKILKLTIFLDDKKGDVTEPIKPIEILKELQNIHLSLDKFLEKFERFIKTESKITHSNEEANKTVNELKTSNKTNGINHTNNNLPSIVNSDLHKEFDPLSNKKLDDDKHILKSSRAETPDSVTSSSDPKRFEFHGQPNIKAPNQLNGDHHNNLMQQQHSQVHHQPMTQHISNQMPQVAAVQPQMNFQPASFQQLSNQQQQYSQMPTQAPQLSQTAFQQPPTNPQQPQQFSSPSQPQLANMYQQQQQYPSQMGNMSQIGNLTGMQQQQQAPAQQQPQIGNLTGMQQPQQAQAQQVQQSQIPSTGMQAPPGGMGYNVGNPYSKSPGIGARPPSATLYQQGYK